MFVGSHEQNVDYAVRFIQSIVCPKKGCSSCAICAGVKNHKNHALLWITPQERYTLDDLETVHEIISLARDPHDHYFFVFSHAELLSTACANTLLKIVEEPPMGYHFIFLTNNRESILPTIRSRCLITLTSSLSSSHSSSPLMPFFTTVRIDKPALFLSTLENSKITEKEAVILINEAASYWIKIIKQSPSGVLNDAYHALAVLQRALSLPPNPGSSKIFLKNVYLELKTINI